MADEIQDNPAPELEAGDTDASVAFDDRIDALAQLPDEDPEQEPEQETEAKGPSEEEADAEKVAADPVDGEDTDKPAEGDAEPVVEQIAPADEAQVVIDEYNREVAKIDGEEFAALDARIEEAAKAELDRRVAPLIPQIKELREAQRLFAESVVVEELDDVGAVIKRERPLTLSEVQKWNAMQERVKEIAQQADKIKAAVEAEKAGVKQQAAINLERAKFDKFLGMVGKVYPALKGYEREITTLAQNKSLPVDAHGQIRPKALEALCRLEREEAGGKQQPVIRAADVAKAAEQRVKADQQKKALGKIGAGKPASAMAGGAKPKSAMERAKNDLDAHDMRLFRAFRDELGITEG